MKKAFCGLLLIGLMAVAGCETWHGLGQDIENLGHKIKTKD